LEFFYWLNMCPIKKSRWNLIRTNKKSNEIKFIIIVQAFVFIWEIKFKFIEKFFRLGSLDSLLFLFLIFFSLCILTLILYISCLFTISYSNKKNKEKTMSNSTVNDNQQSSSTAATANNQNSNSKDDYSERQLQSSFQPSTSVWKSVFVRPIYLFVYLECWTSYRSTSNIKCRIKRNNACTFSVLFCFFVSIFLEFSRCSLMLHRLHHRLRAPNHQRMKTKQILFTILKNINTIISSRNLRVHSIVRTANSAHPPVYVHCPMIVF